jgi:hypothetical protein
MLVHTASVSETLASALRPGNNSLAENMDGTKNNGKIKIEALRRTYAGLKWIGVNRKYKVGWLAI